MPAPGFLKHLSLSRLLRVLKPQANQKPPVPQNTQAIIAVMGGTGVGKSTASFIKQATGNNRIVIGHEANSETFEVRTYTYTDPSTGASVILVDTPGFDDSRLSDTAILEKIAAFLQANGGRKLNGIIYIHNILVLRVGGLSRAHIRMFRELCGADRLHSVRIVTTHWDQISVEEGNRREAGLARHNGPFPLLTAAGARMRRQDNGKTSAQSILSELIPNAPVLMKITEEMRSGKALGETSAGGIVAEEITKLQKRHEEEIAELLKEMEKAAREKNDELRAELLQEHQELEQKMRRVAEDERILQVTRMKELEKKLEREMQNSANLVEGYERMMKARHAEWEREAEERVAERRRNEEKVKREYEAREAKWKEEADERQVEWRRLTDEREAEWSRQVEMRAAVQQSNEAALRRALEAREKTDRELEAREAQWRREAEERTAERSRSEEAARREFEEREAQWKREADERLAEWKRQADIREAEWNRQAEMHAMEQEGSEAARMRELEGRKRAERELAALEAQRRREAEELEAERRDFEAHETERKREANKREEEWRRQAEVRAAAEWKKGEELEAALKWVVARKGKEEAPGPAWLAADQLRSALAKQVPIIMIMGATGTGKSTFIKNVTGDESIIIGHKRSQTSDIQTYFYVDPTFGASVLLIDTPGFEVSREGVTDTDILERIGKFLRDNGGRKLSGILYMHRISDVRMGGVSRKNLKVSKALCGDEGLKNVRIVTTNWDRVRGTEGEDREADLAGPDGFEKFITGGAKMVRQDNEAVSARAIISELVPNKPQSPTQTPQRV